MAGETKGLRQKAAFGMMWSAFQKYSMMFINFISDIILARLLTPYDFGCIGMLAIFMILAETFIDGGFGSALIQKKQPTQIDYSTIFYWNLLISAVLYAILYLGAPAVAAFYNTPLLCNILRIQGIVLFIYAFNIIQHNQLKKNLKFKSIAFVNVVASVVSLIVTIIMAYRGLGVWSLVAKNLISASLISIIFWFYLRWRPAWAFSWKSFRQLFSFGIYMFLIRMVNNISGQVQGLLIGRFYNPSTMGYYSKAHSTERVASKSLSDVMAQVTYPLYAQVQDDKNAMHNMIKRLTMTVSYFTFPMMFILLLLAKPIFILLYTEKWLESVPYFQILCIAGLFECLQSINFLAIPAIGKSKTSFLWTVIKRLAGILIMVGGLVLWGIKGLLYGMVCNSVFSYAVNIGLVSKYIGYKWYSQINDLLPVAFISIMITLLCYGLGHFITFGLYTDGILKLLVYIVIYSVWSYAFMPEAFVYFRGFALPMIGRLKLDRSKNKQ